MVTALCGLAYRKTEAPLKKLFKQRFRFFIITIRSGLRVCCAGLTRLSLFILQRYAARCMPES